jgi:hypothetical protein
MLTPHYTALSGLLPLPRTENEVPEHWLLCALQGRLVRSVQFPLRFLKLEGQRGLTSLRLTSSLRWDCRQGAVNMIAPWVVNLLHGQLLMTGQQRKARFNVLCEGRRTKWLVWWRLCLRQVTCTPVPPPKNCRWSVSDTQCRSLEINTTTMNNFVDCGFVAPYYKIFTCTYTHPHPPWK